MESELFTANVLAPFRLVISGTTSFSLVASIILLASLVTTVTSRFSKERGHIADTTYGWPVVGSLLAYSKDPVSYLRKAAAQYGKVFRANLIFTSVVWLRDPKYNRFYLEVKEHTWSFGDGMGLFLNKIVSPGYFDHLKTFVASLSRGINRKVALDHYTDLARTTARDFLHGWAEEEDIDLFEHISELVHAIIVQCLMGPDFFSTNGAELYDLLHGTEADIGNVLNFILPDWVPHPAALRLRRRRDRIGEIFQERLEEREAHPDQWENAQDYISYTLKDSATAHLNHLYAAHHTLLMFAAHTSTVASIPWTILELLKDSKRMDLLRQELSHNEDMQSSSYLQACLKETGRLYSGISMLRLARQAISLPNTNVTVPQGSVWTPERWLEEPDLPKRLNSGGQLAYMPFGAGVHRCPGEKLAGIIASTVVGTVAQEYDITWGEGKADLTNLDFSKTGSPWLTGVASVTISRKEV
ncbi:hypothetical protein XANCAGTX0491_004108 [Xanthoria calcicola]